MTLAEKGRVGRKVPEETAGTPAAAGVEALDSSYGSAPRYRRGVAEAPGVTSPNVHSMETATMRDTSQPLLPVDHGGGGSGSPGEDGGSVPGYNGCGGQVVGVAPH